MTLFSLIRFIVNHPLNRGRSIQAIGRFVRWQIASRILRVPMALPFVNGTVLLTTNGMTGATGNWYCGLHEPNDMGFVLHVLRPDSLFVDIGANVGSYTVLAAGAVGAKAIAVEPIDITFAALLKNVRINGLQDRVELHQAGVSNCDGWLQFTVGLDTMNRVLAAGEKGDCTQVPVTTLDGICAGRVPTVIKIDVEGHEAEVLAGGIQTLSNPELLAVVMETNGSAARYGKATSALLDTLASLGFQPYGYDVIRRQLCKPDARGGNTIFVRDALRVEARVCASSAYSLVNQEI